MDFSTDRAKLIQKLRDDPANKLNKTFGIPWKSEKLEDNPVYKFDIKYLRFNFDNARIKAERTAKEAQLKRTLNSNSDEDQAIVQQILLNSVWLEKTDTMQLKMSLKMQQQQPAIITFDGVVIDGNRRLACYRTLFQEDGNPQYKTMEVCILPPAEKKDLVTLENRLQLTRSYKVEYGPVNDRLRLREQFRELNFSLAEIKYSINNRWDDADIMRMIEEMDLIDQYLESIGHPKDYPLIEKIGVESFTALWQGLRGPVGQVPKAKEVTEKMRRKVIGFQIIAHPDTTYGDLRQLRDIYRNPQASREFLMNCEVYTDPNAKNIFSIEKTNEVLQNMQFAHGSIGSQKTEPTKLAVQALDKLNHIELDRVPTGNARFAETISKISSRIQQINRKLAGR